MTPRLELVTTGAELLNGRVVNRHAAWLGDQLEKIGWRLDRDTTVPDHGPAIQDAVSGALSRCDVVVVTGGLGPTSDDVTRDVAAGMARQCVIMHEPSRAQVLDVYRQRNKPLNDTVERHALVVEGADVLVNHHGLAPGEHIVIEGKHLFLLPGPPREFQGVMLDHVLPWLVRQGASPSLRVQSFQTVGLGESDIAGALSRHGFDRFNVEAAYCAEPAKVAIRLRELPQHGDDFNQAVGVIHAALAENIYAESEETIEQVVGRLLVTAGRTLAVAESCTGGLLGQRLTAMAGSSAFMRGGVIAYHDDIKAEILHVPRPLLEQHGAVSEPVAKAMADGVRRLARADYGIAITGIAGPGGGSAEKPVGLVFVACAFDGQTAVRQLRLGGGRDVIREASATMALDLVRRCILSESIS